MRIPISSNRTSAANRIAGLDPGQPEAWCDYLKAVRGFWAEQGWLGRLPFLYAQDEPDLAGQRLVARQSKVLHACWPGARSLMTGNPSPTGANRFLSDGRDGDDVDIWAVPQPPLLRPVHGSREAAKPGARAGDDDPGRQARGLGLVVHLQRGRGHAGLRGHRAALEPASLPALERARGAGRRPLRAGHDELRRRRPARLALTWRRLRPALPRGLRADPERSTRADPGRDRGLGALRPRTAPARRR